MKPPLFSYTKPASVKEALSALAIADNTREVRVLAGGQSLMPILNFRLSKPDVLLDINELSELAYIRSANGGLSIGALTRHRTLLSDPLVKEFAPLLAGAATFIGHPAVRNRGTIGGSVSHADPAAELPVALAALDARILLRSLNGSRTLSPEEFFVGPLSTDRRPDELLVEISIPSGKKDEGWGFDEVSRRHGDFALVSAAATVRLDRELRISSSTVALGGIADRPIRARSCESNLVGRAAEAAELRRACADIADDVDANDDIHATADYRRHLASVLAFRTLSQAVRRAREQMTA